MKKITVLLCDDPAIFRESLRLLLQAKMKAIWLEKNDLN